MSLEVYPQNEMIIPIFFQKTWLSEVAPSHNISVGFQLNGGRPTGCGVLVHAVAPEGYTMTGLGE